MRELADESRQSSLDDLVSGSIMSFEADERRSVGLKHCLKIDGQPLRIGIPRLCIAVAEAYAKRRIMTHSPEDAPDTDSGENHLPVFATTQWSVVLAAGATDTTDAQQALSRLCHTYWYPLYAYVRKRGSNPQDAEDLTQEFFARLMRKKSLAHLTREGGRFRSFLLRSMNRFITDEWRRAHAQKRGAGKIVSLDAASAESRYSVEPADRHTPETLYDRAWALVLLNAVFHRLRDEYARAGKAALFDQLKFCLTGQRSAIPYAELASQLNQPESTLKTHVHRLRQRYRELLREEVAQIVASPREIEEELQSLFHALA